MFEFQINGTNVEIHWIAAVLQIVAVFGLVSLFSFVRTRNALKAFSRGATDEKLIKTCCSIKRQYHARADKRVYNLFCTVLAAIALDIKQTDLFFENLNDYKKIDSDSQKRLLMLFLAFIKDVPYRNVLSQCKSLSDNKLCEEQDVLRLYREWGVSKEIVVEKLKSREFRVTNSEVLAVIDRLAGKTGDGSVC